MADTIKGAERFTWKPSDVQWQGKKTSAQQLADKIAAKKTK